MALSIKNSWKNVRQRSSVAWNRSTSWIQKHPFPSFFGLLVLLLGLAILGNYLRKPPAATNEAPPEPRLVTIYMPGESPKMNFTGRVEVSGLITVVAQTGGIVQKVNVTEGSTIKRGQTLAYISPGYTGGNPATVSRQIAQKNAKFNDDTYDLQKDIIAKQRDLATSGDTQADKLREINRKSWDETSSLISLNQDIISSIDDQIDQLESSNVNGSNDSAILAAKQGKSGAQAALNQLQAGLRTSQYMNADDTEPAHISDTSKDLTLKQLDLQEQSLTLAKDISHLNVKLAQISESMSYPSSTCGGNVERVFVKVGQHVNPGDPIAVIKANDQQATVVVPISPDLSKQVSVIESSVIHIGDKAVSVVPRFVSTQPTDGTLADIFYTIPEDAIQAASQKTTVSVTVPIGTSEVVTTTMRIPLDSVYQTQDTSYVYVIGHNDKGLIAQTKTVTLGSVSGQYVEVTSGLSGEDQIITTRGVTDGDAVRTE